MTESSQDSGQSVPAGAARILVVDDDAAVRDLLDNILAGAGYRVYQAADCREAIKLAQREGFDLCILDLVMPDQEGLETIPQFRREFPNLRILAISGAFGGAFLRTAKLLGAHEVMGKPFQPDVLLKTVRRLLAPAEPA